MALLAGSRSAIAALSLSKSTEMRVTPAMPGALSHFCNNREKSVRCDRDAHIELPASPVTFSRESRNPELVGGWLPMRTSTLKAIAVSAFAAMAVISAASAADLAARPYTKAPVMVEVWNWTGFYIGGNAGYSWGRSNTDVSYFNSVTGAPIVPPAGSVTGAGFDMNGAIAGGQIGYNWQSSNWLFGLEADAQWSDERGSAAYRC